MTHNTQIKRIRVQALVFSFHCITVDDVHEMNAPVGDT